MCQIGGEDLLDEARERPYHRVQTLTLAVRMVSGLCAECTLAAQSRATAARGTMSGLDDEECVAMARLIACRMARGCAALAGAN